jgi:DNA modification methylase
LKPYFEAAGVTLYHGDCLEIIPTLPKSDLLLTDPPYAMRRDGKPKSTSSHGGHKGYEFLGWDSERLSHSAMRLVLSSAYEQVIWGGNFYADSLPPKMGWFFWDKAQRIDQSDGELAFTSRDAALRVFTLNRCALLKDGAQHPTQKPLALFLWCLGFFPQCQSVIDPFVGSGTTLIAAFRTGRCVTAIEREEKYCEIAAKRIEREIAQGRLFEPQAIAPARQMAMTLGANHD